MICRAGHVMHVAHAITKSIHALLCAVAPIIPDRVLRLTACSPISPDLLLWDTSGNTSGNTSGPRFAETRHEHDAFVHSRFKEGLETKLSKSGEHQLESVQTPSHQSLLFTFPLPSHGPTGSGLNDQCFPFLIPVRHESHITRFVKSLDCQHPISMIRRVSTRM